MKQLVLIRHAKSSWEFDVIDHERPLNTRGVEDAHLVSNSLQGFMPNLILCSDAERTRQTALIFMSNLALNMSNFKLDHSLYDFSGELLIHTIKAVPSSVNELMIFGHNYAITNFVNTYGSVFINNVPTSGVVIIKFDIKSWSELKKGTTTKTLFPKDLK